IAFSSCSKKEEISIMEEEIEQVDTETRASNALIGQMAPSVSSSDALDLGCFSVDFPFDLNIDGTTVTINSTEDFEAALNPDVEYVDFVYPINITNLDGTTATVNDGEALAEAFAACIPSSGWGNGGFPAFLISESCYELEYPITLINSAGETFVANDEDEFVDLIATNYDLSFQFPLNLVDEDGNTVTADDDEALFGLLIECDVQEPGNGGVNPFGECWDYVYPFEMTDQDGNIVVINNHDDLCNAMLNGLILEHIYPLTLVNGDGEELVVNNDEELNQAWLDCLPPIDLGIDVIGFIFSSDLIEGQECYSLNYPVEYTDATTGEVNSVADEAAAQDLLNDPTVWGNIVLPVTVTSVATGEEVTIEDFESYFTFLTSCQ
ncbi:MAG: hypothetical protein AAF985_05585, partial [Bacteroidota bacterium]